MIDYSKHLIRFVFAFFLVCGGLHATTGTGTSDLFTVDTRNTLTFDAEGGTVSPASTSVIVGAAYGTLPTPTRPGYTFFGWWTGDNGTGMQVTAPTVVSEVSDHTLYAKWTANAYTVTFDAQSGTAASPTSKGVTYGLAYGTLATTTRTGYAFDGWYTSANGAGSLVTATTIVAIAANHTLYAKWTANTYTATYDAEGGVVTPASKSVTFKAAYGTLATPTRPGYTFAGWWTGDNGTGIQVTESTVVSTAANHVIYAKWRGNQTVAFPSLPGKYYGAANFAPGATASSGLAVTYESNNLAVATIVAGKIHLVGAGTATITAAQLGNATWAAATPVTQLLKVGKNALTATAENKTRSFGAANPAFSIAYTGFVTGDTAAVLDTPPTAICSAMATSRAGTYSITASGGSDNNYAFSYAAGTLTITTVVPTVTTTAPVVIGTTTVTSGGNVTNDGGEMVTARGVCWGTLANPTVAYANASGGTGTGTFASTITGLSAGTTYYVRAYAINSAGTAYGEQQSVTTPSSTGPDFVITDIVITPELPAVGGKITVTITVRNQGTQSGKAGYLYAWGNKPTAATVGEKGEKSASISTLKPGQSKTVRMIVTAPNELGVFTLRAFVDAKNGAKEDDEYNNQETYIYETGLPDFEVLEVWLSPVPTVGKTFTAYVTVTNSGDVAGDAGYLDVWADSSALEELPVPGRTTKGNKYKSIGVVYPGQEKYVIVTGLRTPMNNWWPILGILIDSRAKTLELDEDNNYFEYEYECQ